MREYRHKGLANGHKLQKGGFSEQWECYFVTNLVETSVISTRNTDNNINTLFQPPRADEIAEVPPHDRGYINVMWQADIGWLQQQQR